jgi:hypothetical protein
MAKNSGEGWHRGQVADRYQQYHEATERYDKYDSAGTYIGSKVTPGPYKGVEQRDPRKPPRACELR